MSSDQARYLLNHIHAQNKWEPKLIGLGIPKYFYSGSLGFSQKDQQLVLGLGEEGKKLEVSKSGSLETSCSSNTGLLESHDQLASVTEGDSTRLVPVSMRQTKSWIHIRLRKSTASVSQELGLQIHATTPGFYKVSGIKFRSSCFCSRKHFTS